MMFIFLRKLLFKKLFGFKVIYIICNTEEYSNILYLLHVKPKYKETKYIIDCVSVIPIDDLAYILL